jgi:SSS family solute:Na+ symporter
MRQFKFMRAFYGMSVCGLIGVLVTLFTRPEPLSRQGGLVWGTISDAIRRYKGKAGDERRGRHALAQARIMGGDPIHAQTGLPLIRISTATAAAINAGPGDMVHVSDRRAWLGGLRSTHAVVGEVYSDDELASVELGATVQRAVIRPARADEPIRLELLC